MTGSPYIDVIACACARARVRAMTPITRKRVMTRHDLRFCVQKQEVKHDTWNEAHPSSKSIVRCKNK